mmetsp:Transcript_10640/g.39708  ORF Transcript_10640/g.39708 Transcript_10640/m.39708 type:complete len:87 (-) Transcript_10640:32-292(-)
MNRNVQHGRQMMWSNTHESRVSAMPRVAITFHTTQANTIHKIEHIPLCETVVHDDPQGTKHPEASMPLTQADFPHSYASISLYHPQ